VNTSTMTLVSPYFSAWSTIASVFTNMRAKLRNIIHISHFSSRKFGQLEKLTYLCTRF